jgi:chemotaxis signal transduction protein
MPPRDDLFLLAQLGENLLGFPISICKEVQKNIPITMVPFAPKHILGLGNFRGEAVSIYNLNHLLNLPVTKTSLIIRIQLKDRSIAVAVNNIVDVAEITQETWKEIRFHKQDQENDLISHIAELELGRVKRMNIEKLFP